MSKAKTVTEFCHVEVPLVEIDGQPLSFFVDGNSKITGANGTMAEPVPNAFSLPHMSTCPGATKDCLESYYVHGLQKYSPETYRGYINNVRVLNNVLLTPNRAEYAAQLLAGHIQSTVTQFRWHVSGDVFSLRYAEWISRVVEWSPDVLHWIYTRTLAAVPLLNSWDNIVVNVSGDSRNWKRALEVAKENGLRFCYLTKDGTVPPGMPKDSIIFPDYEFRGRELPDPTAHPWWQELSPRKRRQVCPADFFGQSEKTRCGVCTKCMVPFQP